MLDLSRSTLKMTLLFITLMTAYLAGQSNWPSDHFMMRENDRQPLKFSHQFLILPTTSPDTNRVFLFIKLSNPALQFIKEDTLFKAQYELSIAVQNENQNILDSKIVRRQLAAASFNETRNPEKITREFFDLTLPPGEYELIMELYDLEIKKPFRTQQKLTVSNFHKLPIASTDIFFLKKITHKKLKDIKPLMPPVRLMQDTSFYARIDLFSVQEQKVMIYASIINNQEKRVFQDTLDIHLKGRRQPVFFRLSHQLPFGEYTLNLHLISGEYEKTLEAKYYIRWHGHPETLSGMNMVIGPLNYIMNHHSWDELNSADDEEQKQIIETFWKQRDPTPNTITNELEEEFFRRVAFSNQHFSVYKGSLPGWLTDRGRIYILYGPPSDVDVPPTRPEAKERYEIWIYQNGQRRFVFFDKYHDGDYQLISQD